MAQRVNVVLVDDIDGSDAEETVNFGIDGAQYEIDLSTKNAERLREVLSPYLAHARRTGGRRARSAGAGRAKVAAGSAAPADIRAWARENGWDVPDRGRVSKEVREAYESAH